MLKKKEKIENNKKNVRYSSDRKKFFFLKNSK